MSRQAFCLFVEIQTRALYKGIIYFVIKYIWKIGPNNIRSTDADLFCNDLFLPIGVVMLFLDALYQKYLSFFSFSFDITLNQYFNSFVATIA